MQPVKVLALLFWSLALPLCVGAVEDPALDDVKSMIRAAGDKNAAAAALLLEAVRRRKLIDKVKLKRIGELRERRNEAKEALALESDPAGREEKQSQLDSCRGRLESAEENLKENLAGLARVGELIRWMTADRLVSNALDKAPKARLGLAFKQLENAADGWLSQLAGENAAFGCCEAKDFRCVSENCSGKAVTPKDERGLTGFERLGRAAGGYQYGVKEFQGVLQRSGYGQGKVDAADPPPLEAALKPVHDPAAFSNLFSGFRSPFSGGRTGGGTEHRTHRDSGNLDGANRKARESIDRNFKGLRGIQ